MCISVITVYICLKDEVDRLQTESGFKDSVIAEMEENLRNEKLKSADLMKDNKVKQFY